MNEIILKQLSLTHQIETQKVLKKAISTNRALENIKGNLK